MSHRSEGEEAEASLEALVQRTTDVYEALLQREIPNRDAEFNCGRSFLEADRPDLAEDIFRRLLEAGYKPTDSRFRLCQCLFAQMQYIETKSELQKLLQDDPDHQEALEFAKQFQDHVNKEGKLFIYGLLGLAAFVGLFFAYRRSTRIDTTRR